MDSDYLPNWRVRDRAQLRIWYTNPVWNHSNVPKDGFFQKFEVFDKEFRTTHFLKKVDQYYANCTKNEEGQGKKND